MANSSCSGCEKEEYCEKLDWKEHKSRCPILKQLSKKLKPYLEVLGIILDIMNCERNG
jgi:hypothetical protein